MAFPAALLRAWHPYLTTLGMRRVTSFPIDVAIGDEGRLYFLGRTELGIGGNIRIISWDDEDLGAMADTGLTRPVCLIGDAEENLYVYDEAAHTITVYNKAGEEQAKWGCRGGAPGELYRPSGIAFDAAGEGEFNRPAGIAVDEQGDLYVADRGNNRVQLFDRRSDTSKRSSATPRCRRWAGPTC